MLNVFCRAWCESHLNPEIPLALMALNIPAFSVGVSKFISRIMINKMLSLSASPRTPAMIGCSFVVDREYFGDIGLLDPGMEVYGGENIELGMRVSTTDYLPMQLLKCTQIGILIDNLKCGHCSFENWIKCLCVKQQLKLLGGMLREKLVSNEAFRQSWRIFFVRGATQKVIITNPLLEGGDI